MDRKQKAAEPTAPDTDEAGGLRAEIARLNKVVRALINRAEQSNELQGSDFSLFQTAALLEDQVRARTEALEKALRENERIRRDLTKSEAKFSAMFSLTPDPVVLTRLSDGTILDVSRSGAAFFGYQPEEVLGQTTRSGAFNIWTKPEHQRQWLEAVMLEGSVHGFETSMRRKDGSIATVLVSGKIIEIAGETCVLATAHDITERKWDEAHERLRADIMEKLARGMELPVLLGALVHAIEAEQPDCIVSIMLIDAEGRMHWGAAPNLPDFYLSAMEGKQIGDGVGSCGTAAFRGEIVVVDDIQNHPYWARCRGLAAEAGLAACWSHPVFDAHGRVVATIATYARRPHTPSERDIAYLAHAANIASIAISRHRDEETLRLSEAKFAAMFRLTPEPMALTRLSDGVILDVSGSYAQFLGYQPHEIIGRSTRPEDLGIWLEAEHRREWVKRIGSEGEVIGFETPLRCKDGSIGVAQISGKVIDIGGEQCVIVNFHDITEQKQHAEHMEKIAQHDSLTGLPNRLLLGDRLRQAIARSQREGSRVAICYLDLDGFKEVNDQFGHQAGDQVLIEVAARLTATVRGGDTVARLGGDEFVILLSGLAGDEECRLALDRLLLTCAAPYAVGGSEQAGISASIGVTVYPSDRVDPDTLIRHADHAMYVAKQAGKNRFQMFDTRLEQRIEARHATLRQLAEALKAGQFRLHFQPKVDCRRGVVVGAEALIRWQHPTMGLLSPAEFVPLLEDTDLAIDVGDWVIRETLDRIAGLQHGGVDFVISVNAFIRQLLHPDFVAKLAAELARFPDVRPNQVQIEIVETAALKELDALRLVMEDCRTLGVGFALDDFGTGYSTLAHLRHLPASEIKIDQSFVGHMLVRPEDLAIVEAVLGLGRAFGRSVVAEGAETPAHIAGLLALGCDVMQGYALARPMAPDDFLRWLRDFRPDPAWLAAPGEDNPARTQVQPAGDINA
ncbi:MAG: EAL domain-containing protein [Rhodocyclales bacterium]|nr:EAL domain-containing protein [Rhodocyclales bacterium]